MMQLKKKKKEPQSVRQSPLPSGILQRNYPSPLAVPASQHGWLGVNELIVRWFRWRFINTCVCVCVCVCMDSYLTFYHKAEQKIHGLLPAEGRGFDYTVHF